MMIEEVRKAARVIHDGGIILYPTDTIWGIGCDAVNREAVEKIYRIKQRADNQSMLILMCSMAMLGHYVAKVPPQAREMLASVTKPTTIIYPGARNLASNLIGTDGSIGIRITADSFCRQLIEITGTPIVSTSANISGEPSPSLFTEIDPSILEKVDYVVQWRQEETRPALPSAIIRIDESGYPTIIRH